VPPDDREAAPVLHGLAKDHLRGARNEGLAEGA
jgi:hypothetical protein